MTAVITLRQHFVVLYEEPQHVILSIVHSVYYILHLANDSAIIANRILALAENNHFASSFWAACRNTTNTSRDLLPLGSVANSREISLDLENLRLRRTREFVKI